MCEYCSFDPGPYYRGKDFNIGDRFIDGSHQNFEVCLLSCESCNLLLVDGVHTSLEIKINYCPMCGRKL